MREEHLESGGIHRVIGRERIARMRNCPNRATALSCK
jgi:hypothetical protein